MTTYQYEREIPAEDGYDLVVAGGGPAGAAAAICAARLGARVLLVEQTACLGGMGTSGLVTAFDPMSDGEKMLVGGIMREIVETLYEQGWLGPDVTPDDWQKRFHFWTPFNAEGLKLLLDELAVDAGVEVRLFTRVIDADADPESGEVRGVVLHSVEGCCYVGAKTFVDATGDAVLADLCGVACREAGRDTDGIMPPTLCSLHAGIDWNRFDKSKQQALLEQAVADGHFTQPDRHFPGMYRIGEKIGYLNAGHMFNMNALRVKDLTDGAMLGRRLVQEYIDFFRKYMPGCEDIEHVTTAALIGVRESRRIVGEYELNIDDYKAQRKFPDQIGLFNKAIDIHPFDTSVEEFDRFYDAFHKWGRYGTGEAYGFPYGMLVPKGWQNLWVAGRCASSDVQVHGSIRVMPAATMMGQAAGTAAVQSTKSGRAAAEIDTAALVETLRDAGAYLPQETLSAEMTRPEA